MQKDQSNGDHMSGKHEQHKGLENDSLPWPANWFVWSEDADKLGRVVSGLGIVCGLLFVVDLFVHRHAYFDFEASSGFYAIAGFFSFAIIVLLAGQLRRLIKRPENYYGIHATSAEDYPEEGLDRQQSPEFAADSSVNENVSRHGDSADKEPSS